MPDEVDRNPEAEENLLRNMLANIRARDPGMLQRIAADVFVNGLEDHSLAVLEKTDDDSIVYGYAVIVRGVKEATILRKIATRLLQEFGTLGEGETL